MDPHSSHTEIARKRRLWQEAMEDGGHAHEHFDIPMARLMAIAPTDAEAEAVARRGAGWMLGSYVGGGTDKIVGMGADAPMDLAADVDPVDRYVDQVMVWGSPSKVIDELTELRETIPLSYLMAAPLSGQSFDLLTERVLPAVIG